MTHLFWVNRKWLGGGQVSCTAACCAVKQETLTHVTVVSVRAPVGLSRRAIYQVPCPSHNNVIACRRNIMGVVPFWFPLYIMVVRIGVCFLRAAAAQHARFKLQSLYERYSNIVSRPANFGGGAWAPRAPAEPSPFDSSLCGPSGGPPGSSAGLVTSVSSLRFMSRPTRAVASGATHHVLWCSAFYP